jgi:hypothetical protein
LDASPPPKAPLLKANCRSSWPSPPRVECGVLRVVAAGVVGVESGAETPVEGVPGPLPERGPESQWLFRRFTGLLHRSVFFAGGRRRDLLDKV